MVAKTMQWKLLLLVHLLLRCLPLFSQETLILEYYDDPADFSITQEDNSDFRVTKYAGMNLISGDTITSQKGNIELQLLESESNILVQGSSALSYGEADSEVLFNMSQGTVRIDANDTPIRVSSNNTVAIFNEGDIILDYTMDEGEKWYVLEGDMEVVLKESGDVIQVVQKSTTTYRPDGSIVTAELDDRTINQLLSAYSFSWLTPMRQDIPLEIAEQQSYPEIIPRPIQEGPVRKANMSADNLLQWTPLSESQKKLRGGINFDTGMTTLLDETYFSIAARPWFSVGRFSMEFYLPFRFRSDIVSGFDAFALPGGGVEWSFGSDYNWQSDPWGGVTDIFGDLVDKIHYVRFATIADPFFLYLGNIENITLGYGLVVNKYNNNVSYPLMRKIGLFTSIDLNYWGLQVLAEDIVRHPSMYYARMLVRPIAKRYRMEIGLSAGADFIASSALDVSQETTDNNAWISNVKNIDLGYFIAGADIKFPLIDPQNPLSPLALVAETSFIFPLTNKVSIVFDQRLFDNWPDIAGIMGGLAGEIAPRPSFSMSYQINVRYLGNLFINQLLDSNYPSNRYAFSRINGEAIENPETLDAQSQIIGITAGLDMLFIDLVSLNTSLWVPIKLAADGAVSTAAGDQLFFSIGIETREFPVSFKASFRRRNFLAYFLKPEGYSGTSFLDSDTVIDATLSFNFGSAIISVTGSTANELGKNNSQKLSNSGNIITGGSLSFDISFGI